MSVSKIKQALELQTELQALKQKNQKIVFTNGCFDLLHVGHIRCLQKARSFGDVLVVGLNSDQSVRRLKGDTRPVVCQQDRAEVLAALSTVDYVCIFEQDTPYELIECLKPDILVKGGDYQASQIVGADLVQSWGGSVQIVAFQPGHSTSRLLELTSTIS